jgi:hypothetical protein
MPELAACKQSRVEYNQGVTKAASAITREVASNILKLSTTVKNAKAIFLEGQILASSANTILDDGRHCLP